MNSNIAFVTTCKGRLHHIKVTLPLLVAQAPKEIILVDYACPDSVGDWVEVHYPKVKVVRVTDDDGFCVARARNLGAAQATADWICFIDADIQAKAGWIEWMSQHLDSRFYYRAAPKAGTRVTDTWGTCICYRETFQKLGGYDEVFRGWGGEDDDLYRRMFLADIATASYPAEFVEPIEHTDAERTVFYQAKQVEAHHCVNRFYLEAKYQMMVARSDKAQPPIELRRAMMKKIEQALAEWKYEDKKLISIDFSARGMGWLPPPYVMKKDIEFTLSMAINESPGSTEKN